MGFAASQARLIVLTQRKSDLELRMQQISNAEMMLAMQSEEVANEYTRKLSNQTARVNGSNGETMPLTAETLAEKGLKVVDQNGNTVFGVGADGTPVDELGSRSKTTYSIDYSKLRKTLENDPRFQSEGGSHSIDVPEGVDATNGYTDEYGNNYTLNPETGKLDTDNYRTPNQEAINTVIQSFSALGGSISEASFQNTEITLPGFDAPITLSEFLTDDATSSPVTATTTSGASSTGYDRGSEILDGIKSGKYQLQKYDHEKGAWVQTSPDSNVGVSVGYDTSDDAAAEAEYNAKTAAIQTKEKRLQTEMVQVQAQQKACETEMESVKKLVEKNTDQIFKYYN